MSPRSWRERIEDILSCAQNIRDFTAGMSFEAFLDDPKTIRAVAYEFTTLGEAARAISLEIQKQFPDIPWGKMQRIRNVSCMSISVWVRKSSGKLVRRISRL